jgi:ferredoxin
MYKVKVDKETCIGCGLCSSICEKVFEMKDGKAYVKTAKTDEKCAKEAEESCPVNAIKLEKA